MFDFLRRKPKLPPTAITQMDEMISLREHVKHMAANVQELTDSFEETMQRDSVRVQGLQEEIDALKTENATLKTQLEECRSLKPAT